MKKAEKGKEKNHVALYRKYRPQSFADVLGQDHIVSVLEGAVKKNNISHAYLFSGSRGTGKTSIARIFARAVGTSEEDLYEIDAASNRGIDDIRELREGVTVLPFSSPYKVYLIDEVHMLTKEAFNALLKTLEEPPAHALFMLATTEFDKLPETIISRCETHTFKKPTTTLLKDTVTKVAKSEGYTLEPSSADIIALLADGSFRDALGILQKVITLSTDKKIQVDEVEQVTGAPRGELVNDILKALAEQDLEKGLRAVRTAIQQNVDMRVFLKLTLEKLRTVLLLRHARDMKDVLKEEYSDSDFALLETLAGESAAVLGSSVLKRFLEAYDESDRSYVRELPLELALIDSIKQEKL